MGIGLASLEILLDEGQRKDWFGSNLIVTAAVLAVIALVGVVVWELRQKEPIVDFRILANRNFALSALMMYAAGFMMYGSTAILPIFLQSVLGYSAFQSGLVLAPGGVALMIGMIIVGRVIGKIDTRWLIMAGLTRFIVRAFSNDRSSTLTSISIPLCGRAMQAGGRFGVSVRAS